MESQLVMLQFNLDKLRFTYAASGVYAKQFVITEMCDWRHCLRWTFLMEIQPTEFHFGWLFFNNSPVSSPACPHIFLEWQRAGSIRSQRVNSRLPVNGGKFPLCSASVFQRSQLDADPPCARLWIGSNVSRCVTNVHARGISLISWPARLALCYLLRYTAATSVPFFSCFLRNAPSTCNGAKKEPRSQSH